MQMSQNIIQSLLHSFLFISTDFLPVYENKYYLQVYLDNCGKKITNKEMADYLDQFVFED